MKYVIKEQTYQKLLVKCNRCIYGCHIIITSVQIQRREIRWSILRNVQMHLISFRATEATLVFEVNASHYDDVIMSAIASQITSLTIVYSIVYSDADQRNVKAPRHWPVCGDRWIPRTKGQLRGKCFHLMTSSCAGGSEEPIYSIYIYSIPSTEIRA